MHKRPILCTAAATLLTLLLMPQLAPAAPADRFLHVQVSQSNKNGDVNVNLPLSVAEKVLPTIDRGPLHQGRVTVDQDAFKGIDIPTILEAIRTSPDNQIVSAKQDTQTVNIEKSHGNIVIHVTNSKSRGENVDVTVPLSVVDALFSGTQKNELDVVGALQALDKAGDTFLVTVQSATEHVRVWVDSNSQAQ
jgi:hypothetical protein